MAGRAWNQRRGKMMKLLCALILLACMNAVAAAQVPCRYNYVTWPNMDCGFGPFPGTPVAINVHGHVAGRWVLCGDPVTHTFIWNGSGAPVILPIPPGYRSMRPEDMNDLGEIVGTLELPTGTPGPDRAFLRRANGQVIDLGLPPGATVCFGTAINNHSEVVGFATTPNGNRAFLWKDGAFTYLNLPAGPSSQALDLNDASQVTGWMGDSFITTSCAFIWQNGQTITINPLRGTTNASGLAISQGGAVLGQSRITISGTPIKRSFFYQSGSVTELPTFDQYQSSRGTDCNDTVILGRAEDGVSNPTCFIWSDGQIRRLSDLIQIPDLVLPSTGIINAEGRIAIAGRMGVGADWVGLVLAPVFQIGDATNDCLVNVSDLLLVISDWGKVKSPADVNQDGIVDVHDILVVIQNWST
jgi:probable HAF family extracellular repeat protein